MLMYRMYIPLLQLFSPGLALARRIVNILLSATQPAHTLATIAIGQMYRVGSSSLLRRGK
ncbi:hypothetical protein DXT74_01235 [Chromobacterium sp. Rain0013]|nr:hypothetical protein DXT74_01235 [Chromobacterium sp. Rain0013]